MKIAIPKETFPGETRVAAAPEAIKKLVKQGLEVVIEAGAGSAASIPDAVFTEAGAAIEKDKAKLLGTADAVFTVRAPVAEDIAKMKAGAILVGMLAPYDNDAVIEACVLAKVDAFAMELLPRITRAQSMDVLSSQSNLAGYRMVIEAANEFGRAFPMMMTAAGTVPPARVCVLGAGVAGLQAIATAKRLGAIISAFDVRKASKEEVESLGATFIEVEGEDMATKDGYAREASEDYKKRQADLVHETLKKQDIVLTTALIPGKKAPVVITEAMVKDMKPGSVIVDLAAERGGNCELTREGKVVRKHGVTIVGHVNMPGRIPVDSSALYARNLVTFLTAYLDDETKTLAIDWEDEIIKGIALTRNGKRHHPVFGGKPATKEA
ncbi:MAG: Re/Si-specific NAD(P)(+) transhydrogenase subunit alpha [Pseudomonadota bacterium]|nr:Re/Si-specific NAD(P)(+) transhydrogenase subunit alpha [Pseudomonadota bacterium]